jgi:hypothetical protein
LCNINKVKIPDNPDFTRKFRFPTSPSFSSPEDLLKFAKIFFSGEIAEKIKKASEIRACPDRNKPHQLCKPQQHSIHPTVTVKTTQGCRKTS